MQDLVVSLFGPARVRPPMPKRARKAQPPRKVADLLGYLLLGGRRTYERAELAEHFWGDQGSCRARRCLSTAVWRLRQVLEPDGVPQGTYLKADTAETLAFNWASAHHIDVVDLEAVLDRTLSVPAERMSREDALALESGLTLYKGEFLSGAHDFWALRERDRLSARHLDGMSHLLRYKLHTGQYQSGLSLGARILERDPLREDVHRDIMRLNMRTGQRCRAIQQYHQCRTLLRCELQVEPAPETEATYQAICQGQSADLDGSSEMVDKAMDRLHRALEELDSARALVERLTRKSQ